MVKRSADVPPGPVARLDGGSGVGGKATPEAGGNGDGPGPILQAGWRLFGNMSRGRTIAILAVCAWIVVILAGFGIYSLFAGS